MYFLRIKAPNSQVNGACSTPIRRKAVLIYFYICKKVIKKTFLSFKRSKTAEKMFVWRIHGKKKKEMKGDLTKSNC